MEKKRFGFPKREHLKSKSAIENLYANGSSVTAFPLRAVFLSSKAEPGAPTAAILISVAKRRFRHAVDRNLMKRRIREAYRLNKQPFIDELQKSDKQMAVAILYIDNRHSSTQFLHRKMQKLLSSIIEKELKVCENS
ncbi:MAG: ribonuclease P protein component [Bacteroidaceae bacterium]|nr:ribonuclease P protein component [Bacteroidaceae bacterium]MBQ8449771.1 ribonuclease P protein component [Bacteroidaceae bacterium]